LTVAIAILSWALFAGKQKHSESEVSLKELTSLDGRGLAAWDGRRVLVKGYWHGPYEGISVATSASWNDGEFLLMKCTPDFQPHEWPIATIIPAWCFPKPILVRYGDYVKIRGIFHATGYDDPGTILNRSEWLELYEIELWDRAHMQWKRVVGWL